MTFIPVDHDPFPGIPAWDSGLRPIDHDPFNDAMAAQAQAASPGPAGIDWQALAQQTLDRIKLTPSAIASVAPDAGRFAKFMPEPQAPEDLTFGKPDDLKRLNRANENFWTAFGDEPLGVSKENQDKLGIDMSKMSPKTQAIAVAIDAVARTGKAALPAGVGYVAGLYEHFTGDSQGANQLERDLNIYLSGKAGEVPGATPHGTPRPAEAPAGNVEEFLSRVRGMNTREAIDDFLRWREQNPNAPRGSYEFPDFVAREDRRNGTTPVATPSDRFDPAQLPATTSGEIPGVLREPDRPIIGGSDEQGPGQQARPQATSVADAVREVHRDQGQPLPIGEGSVPSSFRRRDSGGAEEARRVDGTPVVAHYDPTPQAAATWQRAGITPVSFQELPAEGAPSFHAALASAKQINPKDGAAVTLYPAEDYAGMRTFIAPDNSLGFALKGDDIVSVFRRPDAEQISYGSVSIMDQAVGQGGRRLDAFDTVLPALYSRHGFRVVARMPWSDEYAPEGWDYNHFKAYNGGRPDVVFMVYDPTFPDVYKPGDGKMVASYDDAMAIQSAEVERIGRETGLSDLRRDAVHFERHGAFGLSVHPTPGGFSHQITASGASGFPGFRNEGGLYPNRDEALQAGRSSVRHLREITSNPARAGGDGFREVGGHIGTQAIDDFIAKSAERGRGNEWVKVPEGEMYLRYAKRPDLGRSLEFSNLAFETRGTGAFTDYLRHAESMLGKTIDAVYVENVLNDRLTKFLERRGYDKDTNFGLGPPSFVKKSDGLGNTLQGIIGKPMRPISAQTKPKTINGLPYTDLGKLRLRRDIPMAQAIQDYVLHRGRLEGKEFVVAVDGDGSIIAHGRGTENQVAFPKELVAAIRDPNGNVVAHHNHPTNSSFSASDYTLLVNPGLEGLWAHGHGGAVSRAELTAEARAALSGAKHNEQLAKRFKLDPQARAQLTGHSLDDQFVKLRKAVNRVFEHTADIVLEEKSRGKLSLAAAAMVHSQLVARALQDAGIIHYDSNIDPLGIVDAHYGSYIAEAADKAAKDIYGEHGNPGVDRRASDYSHPGDVGTSFAESGTAPRPGSQQGGGNRTRQGNDRTPEGSGVADDSADALAKRVEQDALRVSPRYIQAKKAGVSPADSSNQVDLAAMKSSAPLFQHNIELLREYPNITEKQAKASSPDALAEHFAENVKDNLLWLHSKVPPEIRERSKLWYVGANKIAKQFSENYGHSVQTVAGVIAALSPQKDWFKNVSLAERVMKIYRDNQDDVFDKDMQHVSWKIFGKDKYAEVRKAIFGKKLSEIEHLVDMAAWMRVYDEAKHPPWYRVLTPEGDFGPFSLTDMGKQEKVAWGSLPEIAKAIAIIETDGDVAEISSLLGERHKVRSFYNNIAAPDSLDGDVTIDTHAVAAGLLRPLSSKSVEVAHNFGNWPGPGEPAAKKSKATGIWGMYPIYAEAYRRAAKEVGLLPRELQSITWEAVRGLFPQVFRSSNRAGQQYVEELWDGYRTGRLKLDEVRNAIYGYVEGIQPPAWAQTGQPGAAAPGPDEGAGNPADQGQLHRAGVSGPAPGAVDSGARAGAAGTAPGQGAAQGNGAPRRLIAVDYDPFAEWEDQGKPLSRQHLAKSTAPLDNRTEALLSAIDKQIEIGKRMKYALNAYLSNAYSTLNWALRNGHERVLDEKRFAKEFTFREIMLHLDTIISKTKLKEDMVLYRGVGQTLGNKFSSLPIGAVIHDPAFMSTSTSVDVASGFAAGSGVLRQYIIQINAPKGTKALDLGDFFKRNVEREVLFPRNTALRYVGATTAMNRRLTPIYQFEVVPPEAPPATPAPIRKQRRKL